MCAATKGELRPELLETERLKLRHWSDADRTPFAGCEANGFGLWALELRSTSEFIGFAGLNVPAFEAHFTPAVEVGCRLARPAWGNGYATEAGRAALEFGFEQAGLAETVSFATAANPRSRAVMERLGMAHDPADDFEHPGLPPGHPQRPPRPLPGLRSLKPFTGYCRGKASTKVREVTPGTDRRYSG
jgi:ribosomal-protein-alanine N-acetyltransferase